MDVKKFFKNDRFAAETGVELLEAGKGTAKAKLEITANHLNAVGIVQGGAIFTLADFTFAVASNSHGNIAVAINNNIAYVKAVGSGTLYAEAVETSLNSKIATYNVNITNEFDELIAIFQGMVYRKKELLPGFTVD